MHRLDDVVAGHLTDDEACGELQGAGHDSYHVGFDQLGNPLTTRAVSIRISINNCGRRESRYMRQSLCG